MAEVTYNKGKQHISGLLIVAHTSSQIAEATLTLKHTYTRDVEKLLPGQSITSIALQY